MYRNEQRFLCMSILCEREIVEKLTFINENAKLKKIIRKGNGDETENGTEKDRMEEQVVSPQGM